MDGFCSGYTGQIVKWEDAAPAGSHQMRRAEKIINRNLDRDLINGMPGAADGHLVGVKRIRLTCPVCKRRLLSSVRVGSDLEGILHTLPPHKPKGYKKRTRKVSRKAR